MDSLHITTTGDASHLRLDGKFHTCTRTGSIHKHQSKTHAIVSVTTFLFQDLYQSIFRMIINNLPHLLSLIYQDRPWQHAKREVHQLPPTKPASKNWCKFNVTPSSNSQFNSSWHPISGTGETFRLGEKIKGLIISIFGHVASFIRYDLIRHHLTLCMGYLGEVAETSHLAFVLISMD